MVVNKAAVATINTSDFNIFLILCYQSAEVDSGKFLQETGLWGLERGCKTICKDAFQFGEPRIVCGNKGAAIRVLGELGRSDGMRMEGTGNMFGYEGWLVRKDWVRLVV